MNKFKFWKNSDFIDYLSQSGIAFLLASVDIKNRYKRSVLGPFWISLSMGLTIITIGIVFSQFLNSNLKEYLPHLALGIIAWNYITHSINEGCLAFIDSAGLIKQLPLPLIVLIERVIFRNLIILFHNILIVPIVFMFYGKTIHLISLFAFFGLLLTTICITWISLFFAIICARFRDVPQIVSSVLQVFFYLTPVLWTKNNLSNHTELIISTVNPFYHMLSVIRDPILGTFPSFMSWTYLIIFSILGWIITCYVYLIKSNRIVFWV